MEIKICSDCRRVLCEDDFYWRKDLSCKLGGYKMSSCKKCNINKAKLRQEDNKERNRECNRLWYKNNKEYKKQYYLFNKKHIIEYHKEWVKNNRDIVNTKKAKRRAMKLQATPGWANQEIIDYIYKECAELNKLYPLINGRPKFNVDHYYPLQSDFVCGLHHENNMQIITGKDNCEKNNKCPEEDINLNRRL